MALMSSLAGVWRSWSTKSGYQRDRVQHGLSQHLDAGQAKARPLEVEAEFKKASS